MGLQLPEAVLQLRKHVHKHKATPSGSFTGVSVAASPRSNAELTAKAFIDLCADVRLHWRCMLGSRQHDNRADGTIGRVTVSQMSQEKLIGGSATVSPV